MTELNHPFPGPSRHAGQSRTARSTAGFAHILALCLVLAACGAGWAQSAATTATNAFISSRYNSFADWKAACARLPLNRELKGGFPPKAELPLKSFRELDETLEAFFQQCKTGVLATTNAWVGATPVRNQFFNTETAYFLKPAIAFQPFAQKLVVPAEAEVIFHGDFHGDIQTLIAEVAWLNQQGYLKDFKVARTNVYLVFLGDYTDRGVYGVEVIYTLLRLKLENPERVWLVRGNHEDVSLAARYGFLEEGRAKYGREFDAKRVLRLYDFLPVVLYLGCEDNFLQCNHGGMEPGYSPATLLDSPGEVRFQFLGALNQKQFLRTHPEWLASVEPAMTNHFRDFLPQSPTVPETLGFMWNDFTVVSGEPQLSYDPGRAYVYGDQTTQGLLKLAGTKTKKVQAVFRAHQHANVLNPMMRRLVASRGIFRHWQPADSLDALNASPTELEKRVEQSGERPVPEGSVWTFNVAPDSAYGEGCNFRFDAFGILKTQKKFGDWRLRVMNQTIGK